eukprot:CAMPEP_0204093508 /NCGR_PEP_ID=MMETSP0360-20130528/190452_1 /ASSEMBLY_ACC=CAM_ASM_000342 /TAXON_ID=268821 /ORGANISM="Scrippsiella Hangoei, Strain SHTV-5" /LENGTH=572 /DNA_ID=CAMNT_0051042803 /DNA_START=471 /DNA_END=2187 /DNA_ORIENTATION=+
MPSKTDGFWRKEEQALFQQQGVTKGINFDAYDDVAVELRGGRGKEEPCRSFQECCKKFDLPPSLKDNIDRCGYTGPTPVQKHAMPAALAGTDVMVGAQTGSGKTAAYMVPIIKRCLELGASRPLTEGAMKPRGLILAPTRELCIQIVEEARKLCLRTDVQIVGIWGGAEVFPQLQCMAEGVDLIIATPGRIDDFCARGVVSLSHISMVVLDEADRMLDMGFEPQIRSLVQNYGLPVAGIAEAMLDMGFEPQIRSLVQNYGLPVAGIAEGGRQMLMFSATFPRSIQDLALDFLHPTYLWIGVGRVGETCTLVTQKFKDVSPLDEDGCIELLSETIKSTPSKADGGLPKVLVFANAKRTVDEIAWRLTDTRMTSAQIHGGLTQAARARALQDFKEGRCNILVATDVAARGLDIPGVDHVINFDLPSSGEDYVHRVGRTGRIGNLGLATSFVKGKETALADIVKNVQLKSSMDGVAGASVVPAWVERQALNRSRKPGRPDGETSGAPPTQVGKPRNSHDRFAKYSASRQAPSARPVDTPSWAEGFREGESGGKWIEHLFKGAMPALRLRGRLHKL